MCFVFLPVPKFCKFLAPHSAGPACTARLARPIVTPLLRRNYWTGRVTCHDVGCWESRKAVEHASTVDTGREAEMFLRQHPERIDDFRRWVDYVQRHAHNHHVVSLSLYLKSPSLWYCTSQFRVISCTVKISVYPRIFSMASFSYFNGTGSVYVCVGPSVNRQNNEAPARADNATTTVAIDRI